MCYSFSFCCWHQCSHVAVDSMIRRFAAEDRRVHRNHIAVRAVQMICDSIVDVPCRYAPFNKNANQTMLPLWMCDGGKSM